MSDFSKQLASGLEILGTRIPQQAYDPLIIYFNELKKWSGKVNLIAKSTSDQQIIENHFLDSLTILPLLTGTGTHLLDIGSGAGFPGLVCKTVSQEMAVTLVEPRSKRVSFLGHIVRSLDLKEVNLLPCRVEDEAQLPSDSAFTHITCRAVTEIGLFLQMVERFESSGARLICMKGPKWREEFDAASDIVAHSSYELTEVLEHALPFSQAKRSLLLFDRKTTF